MSKNKKETIEIDDKKLGKRGAMQEEATKTEKIISYVLIGVAFLAIIIIIIVAFLSGGEKKKIANRFDSLSKDNVFTVLSYNKLQEKVQNGEEFEVVLVSNKQESANYFVYCVDLIVKQYQNDEKYESVDTIYLLYIEKLKEEELDYFKKIDKKLLDGPVIIHYKTILKKTSVDFDKSNNYRLEEYGGNAFALLQKYFENNINLKNNEENIEK